MYIFYTVIMFIQSDSRLSALRATMPTFPTSRERSTVLQGWMPESHLFSVSRTDWIGRPGVPPTNTQGGVEKKKHAGLNWSCQRASYNLLKEESSKVKRHGGSFKDLYIVLSESDFDWPKWKLISSLKLNVMLIMLSYERCAKCT